MRHGGPPEEVNPAGGREPYSAGQPRAQVSRIEEDHVEDSGAVGQVGVNHRPPAPRPPFGDMGHLAGHRRLDAGGQGTDRADGAPVQIGSGNVQKKIGYGEDSQPCKGAGPGGAYSGQVSDVVQGRSSHVPIVFQRSPGSNPRLPRTDRDSGTDARRRRRGLDGRCLGSY